MDRPSIEALYTNASDPVAETLQMLADTITVRTIAELNLKGCSLGASVGEILDEMDHYDFDVYPVEVGGIYSKFVERSTLRATFQSAKIGDAMCPEITVAKVLPIDAPIREALKLLRSDKWLFCIRGNTVCGIVTRGDLSRLPARAYLFAILTAFEAKLLQALKVAHPGDEWLDWSEISAKTRRTAVEERGKAKDDDVDLGSVTDYLMLGGKIEVLKLSSFWQGQKHVLEDKLSERGVARTADEMLNRVNRLRNNVAHDNKLIRLQPARWMDVIYCLEFIDITSVFFDRVVASHSLHLTGNTTSAV